MIVRYAFLSPVLLFLRRRRRPDSFQALFFYGSARLTYGIFIVFRFPAKLDDGPIVERIYKFARSKRVYRPCVRVYVVLKLLPTKRNRKRSRATEKTDFDRRTVFYSTRSRIRAFRGPPKVFGRFRPKPARI